MSIVHRITHQVRVKLEAALMRTVALVALSVLLGPLSGVTVADSLIPQGKPAPDVTFHTLGGDDIRVADMNGKIVLLLFGELYNRNSLEAAQEVGSVLAEPAMADIAASAYMIITQKAPPSDLLAEGEKKRITLPILHDPDRQAFATYQVMVLPSLMIIDQNGTVVLASSGYPLDFKDMVTDTLLYVAGRLSQQELDRRRKAEPENAPVEQVRAMRLAALGEQLARRGADDLAISSFQDAIALNPDCLPARIGLGTCLFYRNELAEAEIHFLHALNTAPDSVEASLGVIAIQTLRGGDELKAAQTRVNDLLRKLPNDARVLYHAAVVAEKSGDANTAIGQYKRAAEVLLYGPQRKREP